MRTRQTLRSAALLALGGFLAASSLTGCQSSTSLSAIRANPSPQMDSLGRSRLEIDNRLVITRDTNLRELNEDMGRLFLLNRPTRMATSPIPY